MTTGSERSSGISADDDGKVIMVVAVAIGNSTSVNDHGVVQKGLSIDVLGLAHFLEKVGQLGEVELIDFLNLFEVVFLPLVVGKVVVTFADPNVFEVPVGAVVRHQEGGNTGGVGLKCEDHHIHHEAHVLLVVSGFPGGSVHTGIGGSAPGLGFFELLFNFANTGEVFVELYLIAAAEAAMHGLGIVGDEVEYGFLGGEAIAKAGGAVLGRSAAEEAFEYQSWTAFGGHRLGLGAPGEVELISAGISGIAIAGLSDAISGEFERGKSGGIAHFACGDLVDRNTDSNV